MAFGEKLMAYARLITRNTSGLHPNLRGLGFLGQGGNLMTAADAYQKALSLYAPYNLNASVMDNATWEAKAESQIAAGQFDVGWYSPECAANPTPPLNLFAMASGLGLTAATVTTGVLSSSAVAIIPAAAVPVVGWVIAGVGALVSVISTIFAHHAAAVKRDLAFGCSALPAVNNAFAVIAQAVQNGQLKPSDAAGGIGKIYSEFMSAGGASGSFPSGPSSIQSSGVAINDHPYCNGDCAMSVIVLGMCFYWQVQYQALADEQAASAAAAAAAAAPPLSQSDVSIASPAATSATSLPSPAVPASAVSEVSPTSEPVTVPATGLAAIPAWGWFALAALGVWAVI